MRVTLTLTPTLTLTLYKACYRALIRGEPKPEKVGGAPLPQPVWYECVRIKQQADRKVRGVDYD